MTIDSPSIADDDHLGVLVRQAMSRPLLSATEEATLAERIERGDLSAKARMVESNLRLVVSLARSYRGRGAPLADLVQEGTIGLIRAVERFDHRRGLKFSTYAVWWIRRSLRDAVAGSQAIRIPPRANRQLALVLRAEAELRRLGSGSASTTAIARRSGLSEQSVRALREASRVTASLDEPVAEDGTPLGDLLADDSADDPSERAIASEESEIVRNMLRLLPERHRMVVARRYGLDKQPSQSHQQIGAWLGVSEERSRQLEREALHRLRTAANARAA